MGKYTDFGQRLVWYRSKAQMTQRELADKSGVSLPQITRYETNRSTPRLSAVMKLAKALDLDAEAFTDESPIPDAAEAVIEFPGGEEMGLFISAEIMERLQAMADRSGKTVGQCMGEIVEWYIEKAHKEAIEAGMKPTKKGR